MPKLSKGDWEKLRKDKVAFETMPDEVFNDLVKKVEAAPNTGQLDNTDALMIYLARLEPPIRPQI